MRRAFPTSSIALILALAGSGCQSIAAPSLERRSTELLWSPDPGVEAVEVFAPAGVIRVRAGKELSATVNVEAPAHRAGLLDGARLVDDRQLPGVARLEVETDLGWPPSVAIDLTVPPWVRLTLRSVRADILLDGLAVPVEVTTETGRIVARLRGGEARLVTGSGDIDLDGDFIRAEIESVDGDVEVVVPDRTSAFGRLDVETVRGDVRLTGAEDVFANLLFETEHGAFRNHLAGQRFAEDIETSSSSRFPRTFRTKGEHLRYSAPLSIRSEVGALELVALDGEPSRIGEVFARLDATGRVGSRRSGR